LICERRSFEYSPLWFGWIGFEGEWANGGLLFPIKLNDERRERLLFLKKINIS